MRPPAYIQLKWLLGVIYRGFQEDDEKNKNKNKKLTYTHLLYYKYEREKEYCLRSKMTSRARRVLSEKKKTPSFLLARLPRPWYILIGMSTLNYK